MKFKALLSVAALALAGAQASAQSAAPVAPAPPAAAAVAPAAPAAPAPAALAVAAHAPAAPAATVSPADAPEPAAAPKEPQQTPAPPAPPGAATLFFRGNFLGVRTEEVTRENASRYGVSGEPRGVGVSEVIKGSPAEKAGLRAGDVILRFDGEQVTSARKLTRLIEEAAPEHSARLTVLRSGSEQQLTATLARREPFARMETGPFTFYNFGDQMPRAYEDLLGKSELWERKGEEFRKRLDELQRGGTGLFTLGSSRRIGVGTSTLGKQLADYFGVPHGVLVNTVEANSPADKAGLKAGDVVTEVDGKQVNDVDDLLRALGAKQEGEVTLTVFRDRKQRSVRVTPERRQLPQGYVPAAPGSFNLVRPPVVSMTLPRTVVAPRVNITPRVFRTPRLTVTPSAITVVAPGERIL